MDVTKWVQACLSLAQCGGSHELERDDEWVDASHALEDCEETDDGVILVTEDGRRFAVTVKELAPQT